MDQKIKNAIFNAVENEPFANAMKIRLVELALGYSAVEMIYDPTHMNNIYERAMAAPYLRSLTRLLKPPVKPTAPLQSL